MSRVIFDQVTKRYAGGVEAVKNLTMEIMDNEFLVLVGPSGCGKSTAMRMVAGLEEITEGRIIIGDRVVNDLPPKDRNVAMVFQSYALYPHMSVRDNLAYPLKLAKVPKAPGSLEEALNNLERDHEFLLQGDVFTRDVISTWIWYKREKEVDAIRLRPHPYEFYMYYDI